MIEEDVKLNPPVWIGSGSVIRSGSEIGPNTIIGANCELRACSAENSVLWDGCVAEQGSELRQALLCGGCRIGRHAAVHERAVLGKTASLAPLLLWRRMCDCGRDALYRVRSTCGRICIFAAEVE